MGRFLQGWAIACVVILAAVTVSGFVTPSLMSRDIHVLAGYVATVAVLFSHAISMFYFIGTGAAVKGAARELADQGDRTLVPLWEQTKNFKNALFPVVMTAMFGLMVASIMGAGALTGALPGWVHLVLELLSVPLNLYALLRTVGLIEQNVSLMSAANDVVDRAGN